MMPSYDYINNGFYIYLDSTFNLTDLLLKSKEDTDF